MYLNGRQSIPISSIYNNLFEKCFNVVYIKIKYATEVDFDKNEINGFYDTFFIKLL